MESLKKRENETQLEYIKRIVYGKLVDKTIDNDYTELSLLVFGKEYSSDVARRMFYGVRALLEVIDQEGLKNIKEEEMLQEIENKKIELEKATYKMRDQKRELRALRINDARFDHLKDEMLESIRLLNKSNPLVAEYKGYSEGFKNEAVAIFSDWHYGIEDINYWNVINIKILEERVSELTDKIIGYCSLNKVRILHIELAGDLINGYIHLGTRVSNEEDVISQTMHVSELLAQAINKLAMYIPQIKVYSTLSNHGRCTANKKLSLESENFERLIPWYLEGRLENNVQICDSMFENEDEIVAYQFLNETIVMCHGHNDKVGQAITKLSKMFKVFFTECHLGHYHAYKEFDEYDMTTTVNGTLSGVDKYAKEHRLRGRPSQTLMIYNEKGRFCTYKIKF